MMNRPILLDGCCPEFKHWLRYINHVHLKTFQLVPFRWSSWSGLYNNMDCRSVDVFEWRRQITHSLLYKRNFSFTMSIIWFVFIMINKLARKITYDIHIEAYNRLFGTLNLAMDWERRFPCRLEPLLQTCFNFNPRMNKYWYNDGMKLLIHSKLQQLYRWRFEMVRNFFPHFTGHVIT